MQGVDEADSLVEILRLKRRKGAASSGNWRTSTSCTAIFSLMERREREAEATGEWLLEDAGYSRGRLVLLQHQAGYLGKGILRGISCTAIPGLEEGVDALPMGRLNQRAAHLLTHVLHCNFSVEEQFTMTRLMNLLPKFGHCNVWRRGGRT
jgi:hypothetical protein